MKRLLLSALFVLAGCAAESPPPAATAENAAKTPVADPTRGGARGGTWLHAETLKNGQPIAWDFRDDYAAVPERTRLVVVSLGHEHAFDGSTTAEQQSDYNTRENSLLEALKDRADLVATLDWNQQHDWFFYAGPELSREDVEKNAGERKFISLQVTLEDDPQHDFYRVLRQRVHGTPEKK